MLQDIAVFRAQKNMTLMMKLGRQPQYMKLKQMTSQRKNSQQTSLLRKLLDHQIQQLLMIARQMAHAAQQQASQKLQQALQRLSQRVQLIIKQHSRWMQM